MPENNGDIPDLSELIDIPEGFDPRRIIMPAQFAGPHEMPVHVDVTGAYDDRGTWWNIIRSETIHGSHIVFLTSPVALNVAAELEKSVHASHETPFVPPTT